MCSPWAVIDVLVHDIGALSAQVHVAESTLSSDPRTQAARRALDRATDAVCLAIDETSETAAKRAAAAIEDTRALIAELGLTIENARNLVDAAHKLMATSERHRHRMQTLRRRLAKQGRSR